MNTNSGSHSLFVTLGASNHTDTDREINDYYATDPKALELLLEQESFSNDVWECACGEGHLSEVLINNGYKVKSTDLIDRGYGIGGVDFLEIPLQEQVDADIITNPPYKYAQDFVEKAIESISDGHKVAMFLKLQFLEGKTRRKLFDKYPPSKIYVASGRINCCKNGDFSAENRKSHSSAQAYAWFIWEKPFHGDTVVKWFN